MAILGCILTALLEERDIFSRDRASFDCNLTHRVEQLISLWHKPYGAITNIIKQVKALLKSLKINHQKALSSLTSITTNMTGFLLAYAYPERVAKTRQKSGNFICANGKGVSIGEQDALASESNVVIADLMQIKNVLRVRLAASIELAQIEQIFSQDIVEKELALLDEASGKIIVRKQTKLAALNLSEKVSNKALSTEVISHMWCDFVTNKGVDTLSWQAKDIALKARWQWLTGYLPEYNFPDISEQALLSNLTLWFAPFGGEIKSKAKLAKLDLSAMLLSQLDYQQQQILKQAAPTHSVGPTGRHCPITYGQEKSPKVSLPMQEVYGLQETPMVGLANGAQANKSCGIPLILELLSPAQRPIQITQDLAQFWTGSYKAVQKDMKSRYPKPTCNMHH